MFALQHNFCGSSKLAPPLLRPLPNHGRSTETSPHAFRRRARFGKYGVALAQRTRGRLVSEWKVHAAGRGDDGRGGGSRGRGGGGSGGGSEDSSPGDEDSPFGRVGWGSLLVGCVLGGSLCLNVVLLKWDVQPKGKANQSLPPGVPDEQLLFSAAASGMQKPKTIEGKPESLSHSESKMGSLAVLVLIVGAIYFGMRRKKTPSEEEEETRSISPVNNIAQGGLLPLAPVVDVQQEFPKETLQQAASGSKQPATLADVADKININVTVPQAAHSFVPFPVCLPFPIPVPTGVATPAPIQNVVVPVGSFQSSRAADVSPAPKREDEPPGPTSKKKQFDELDDGAIRQEKEFERLLDFVTPNIRTEYDFKDLIGRGSTGMVRKVVKKTTGAEYACKSIQKQNLRKKKDVEDVKREIKVMRHIGGCDEIVQLHGVYEDRKSIHLVMDLCRGGELFDTIVAAGRYSEKDCANTVRVILKAIAHCHELKVVHRDIKPENFMWADVKCSQLKLLDFGLSAFYQRGSVFKDLVGSKYTIAPEALARSYSNKVDVWGCGVIMYWMLSGYPPFLGDTLREIFDNVTAGNIDYSSEAWEHVSDGAKDCLQKMLAYRQKKRWEAKDLLQHGWINGEGPDAPVDNAVTSRFKAFGGMNRLKQVTRKVIADRLPLDALEGLKNMFEVLDVNRDGTITLDEIRNELQAQKVSIPPEELEEILQAADLDGSGEINISEFLAATVNAVELTKEGNLLMAFEHFDQDGSGFITVDELKSALSSQLSEKPENLQALISDIDKDNDGQISYDEFKNMMLSAA